jgi:mono/diheme cytochrome c family protein
MMPARMPRRLHRAPLVACALALGLGVSACGSESSEVDDPSASVENGARLFVERCSGCHTFDVVGTDGGASKVHDRERVDGPSFDTRREDPDSVLYAIRNGGFSGAIMPENLVVGKEARDVAAFVAKYAGGPRKGSDITPESQPSQAAGGGGGGETTSTTGTQTTGGEIQEQTTGGETREQTTGGETREQTTGGETREQTTPQSGTQTQAQGGGGGDQAAAQGKQVFTDNCAGCHTLSDAGSNGNVGPNLDQARPDRQAVEQKVLNGGGGMPSFRGRLGDDDVAAVSEYVANVAGR